MVIPPIGAVAPLRSPFGTSAPAPAGAASPSGASFGDLVKQGLQSVSNSENGADSLLQQMAAGQSVSAADVMIATQQATLSVQMLTAVRDQAVNAYKDIMNMPL